MTDSYKAPNPNSILGKARKANDKAVLHKIQQGRKVQKQDQAAMEDWAYQINHQDIEEIEELY